MFSMILMKGHFSETKRGPGVNSIFNPPPFLLLSHVFNLTKLPNEYVIVSLGADIRNSCSVLQRYT